MDDKLRLAFGVMGNAASMLLYAAPILTFCSIIRKKSTQEFSCVPYIVALLNCLLYTWYGLPIVSCGWENFSLITINSLGILLESSFIIIYLCFASTRVKGKAVYLQLSLIQAKVAAMTTAIVAVFGVTSLISAFVFHNHHDRKVFVGSIGLVASVAMYSSPLVAVKQVIEMKSVKYMPFYLSFFSFLASSDWMVYGILSHDLFLTIPSLVGCPLSMFQLGLYCKYRDTALVEEVTHKCDVEMNEEETKHVQLVTVV